MGKAKIIKESGVLNAFEQLVREVMNLHHFSFLIIFNSSII